MDNWRLTPKNHGYPCWYPWIFGNTCMDLLWILGPGFTYHFWNQHEDNTINNKTKHKGRRKVFDTESVWQGKCSTGKLVDSFGISGAVRLGFVGQLPCRSLTYISGWKIYTISHPYAFGLNDYHCNSNICMLGATRPWKIQVWKIQRKKLMLTLPHRYTGGICLEWRCIKKWSFLKKYIHNHIANYTTNTVAKITIFFNQR